MDRKTDTLWKDFSRSGDGGSFKELFGLCFEPMCRYCQFFTRDRMDAEEIVLDFFLHLWKQRGGITIGKSFDAYSKTALHNRCLNRMRSRRNAEDLGKARDVSVEEDYEFDTETLMGIVWEAATALPPKCRDIFRMSREEGLTYAQIADRTGLDVKTVEGYMTRALKYMRIAIKKLRILLLFTFPSLAHLFC